MQASRAGSQRVSSTGLAERSLTLARPALAGPAPTTDAKGDDNLACSSLRAASHCCRHTSDPVGRIEVVLDRPHEARPGRLTGLPEVDGQVAGHLNVAGIGPRKVSRRPLIQVPGEKIEIDRTGQVALNWARERTVAECSRLQPSITRRLADRIGQSGHLRNGSDERSG